MTTKGIRDFGRFPEYADAILKLCPNAAFGISYNDYSSLTWQSPEIDVPTEDQIKSKLNQLISEYNKNLYKKKRFESYPTIEEQLEMLWDDMNLENIPGKNTSIWFKKIEKIKENIPK